MSVVTIDTVLRLSDLFLVRLLSWWSVSVVLGGRDHGGLPDRCGGEGGWEGTFFSIQPLHPRWPHSQRVGVECSL